MYIHVSIYIPSEFLPQRVNQSKKIHPRHCPSIKK